MTNLRHACRIAYVIATLQLMAHGTAAPGEDRVAAIMPTPLRDVQVRGDLRERMQRGAKYLDQATRKDLWSGFERKLGDDDSAGMWGGDWPGRTLEVYAAASSALGHPASSRFAEVGYGLIANQASDGSFRNGASEKDDVATQNRKYTGFWFGNARAMNGLLEAHLYDGDREPAWLQAAKGLGDYYNAHYFDAKHHAGSFSWVGDEALAKLYRETGEQKYLDCALRIAESIPPINPESQHAHSYLLSLRGIVQTCELAPGNSMNKALLRKVNEQYAFVRDRVMWPGGGIIEHLGNRKDHCINYWFDEGCAVCDWLGLNLDLWRTTRESRYLDMAERVALNHFLFDQDAGGGFCGDRGVDSPREGTPWPFCCAMHGIRTLAELTRYVGLTNGKEIWLGLYYPATISLVVAGQKTVLELETNYPADGALSLTVRDAGGAEFPIKFRVPQWSKALNLTVNGQAIQAAVDAGYCAVKRKWAPGDRVVMELDLPLRTEARNRFIGDGPDADASRVSLWQGPRQMVYNQELNNHLWKLRPGPAALCYAYQAYGELRRDQSVRGTPLKIGGREYRKGLGVQAVSELVFRLGGQFKEFQADIGVDACAEGNGSVRFKACVDGLVRQADPSRATSGGKQEGMVETIYGFAVSAMTGKDAPRSIRILLDGAEELRLSVDEAVNGLKDDCADWADARLVRADGSAVYLSDLPDERKLGLPSDWVAVTLSESPAMPRQAGGLALLGKIDGQTVPVHFSFLAPLGSDLVRHRPVLVSWILPAPINDPTEK